MLVEIQGDGRPELQRSNQERGVSICSLQSVSDEPCSIAILNCLTSLIMITCRIYGHQLGYRSSRFPVSCQIMTAAATSALRTGIQS
jgi:hypothetical protein